ncbi:serine hydrolase [Aegicerativicinus sediminis]|uniref:serine hydrolase n=1 Tax=Aegicerativicinus sediminis TaxID=2893202 RepID=UPI001E61EC80|nr:serine hydrolase [Aegicerativicinus sediminis]
MNYSKYIPLYLLLLVIGIGTAQNLDTKIDAIVAKEYPADGPGISLLVAKDGKPIYRKAFGMANLELQVPLKPENVFELGSITKQFTAVSILMLQEQGKLKITDEITKYIPDYPTLNKTITIYHLLNHTSGIKSYTDLVNFQSTARLDKTPSEIIDVFKNEPMDFEPGEKFRYNNSGYILLGYIIEQVSGVSYEEFINKNIFKPLGMKHSYYGNNSDIIPNRAAGYKMDSDGYANSDYLSMSLPYAAGSLMSTIDDLLKWQNAINSNKLISKESLDSAIHGSELNNSEHIPYGFGWGEQDVKGSKGYGHGGGIFGYTTNEIYFPKENIYVVGLTNCNCKSIGATTVKVAALALGKPFPTMADVVKVDINELNKWVGNYRFEDGALRIISLKDGQLISQRQGSNEFKIYPLGNNRFMFEDGSIEYLFSGENGKRKVEMTTQNGKTTGEETEDVEPIQNSKYSEINVPIETLKIYTGEYELAPNFILTITQENDGLFAQATGQPKIQIYPFEEDKFFYKVVDAQLTFNINKDGISESVVLHQNGNNIPGNRKN